MKKYLNHVVATNRPGLYFTELPTGYGKSHITIEFMYEYATNDRTPNTCVYITPQVKNLEAVYKKLRNMWNDDESFFENVIWIRSNFDTIMEIAKYDCKISNEIKAKPWYQNLISMIDKYKSICNTKINSNDQLVFCYSDYLSELKKKITEAEQLFRKELKKFIFKKYPQDSRNHVKNEMPWVFDLFPVENIKSKKIILMSMHKFLLPASTITINNFHFTSASFLKNKILFIDESDATKNDIVNAYIEDAEKSSVDYLNIFAHLYQNLKIEKLTKLQKISLPQEPGFNYDLLRSKMEHIVNMYDINHKFFVKDENVNINLFHDDIYHMVEYGKDASNSILDVFFDKENGYNTVKKREDHPETSISLFSVFRDINNFFRLFKKYVHAWALNYQEEGSKLRNENERDFSTEDALRSLLSTLFERNYENIQFFLSEIPSFRQTNKEQFLLADDSFYEQGFELFSLLNQDGFYEDTRVTLKRVANTPEKLLTFISKICPVFMLSATAETPSVLCNYDLNYLKEKTYYVSTPETLIHSIQKEMDDEGKFYEEIDLKSIAYQFPNDETFCPEKELSGLLPDKRIQRLKIKYETKDGNLYFLRRYCILIKNIYDFAKEEQLKSILSLMSALPKKGSFTFDLDDLEYDFKIVAKNVRLFILESSNFNQKKEQVIAELKKGNKVYVLSSYKTVGAAINLQYNAPQNIPTVVINPEFAGEEKDFDAIFLGDITNIMTNLSTDEFTDKDEFRYIYDACILYEHGEISYNEKEEMIQNAIKKRHNNNAKVFSSSKKIDSISSAISYVFIQAIGRLSRTKRKNKMIRIYIDELLFRKMDIAEIKRHPLSEELKSVLTLYEQLKIIAPINDGYQKLLNLNEKQCTRSFFTIKSYLDNGWTKEKMDHWKEMRNIFLKNPTIQKENIPALVKKMYIAFGHPTIQYYYSQLADFKHVHISEKKEKNMLTVSFDDSLLPIYLKYPGMKEFFEQQEYATEFKEKDYIMSPIAFHNIYKGGIGEAANSFILKQELGIDLQDIEEPEKFELFDFVYHNDFYFDMKNWKQSYFKDSKTYIQFVSNKMTTVGAKKAFIINGINDGNFRIDTYKNDSIIVIPGLIDEDGNLIKEALNKIQEEIGG